MEKPKVLITGATGFIGSHLCETLILRGYAVRAFAHYNSQKQQGNLVYLPDHLRRRMEIVWGDIQDDASVSQIVCY